MHRDGEEMARRVKQKLRKRNSQSREFDVRRTRELKQEGNLSTYDLIQRIAKRDARLEFGEKHNRIFLTNWWCNHYNRPLKDPLLQQYTLEELAYEYYLVGEIALYQQEKINKKADKIEEEKLEAAEAWADQMEKEEQELEELMRSKKSSPTDQVNEDEPQNEIINPESDPRQVEWMEEQIKQNKLVFGEDFGDDIKLDFGDD